MGDRGIIFFVKMFASGWRRFLIWRTIPRIIGISFVCFYNIFRLRAKPRVPEKKRNDIHCFTRSSQGQNEKRTRMVTTLIIIFFSGTFFPRFSFAGFQYTPPCLRLVKKRGCRFFLARAPLVKRVIFAIEGSRAWGQVWRVWSPASEIIGHVSRIRA